MWTAEESAVARAYIDYRMSIQHHASRMPDMVSCLCSVPSSALLDSQCICEEMDVMNTTHSASVTGASDLEYAASRLRRRYTWPFSVALRRWPDQPYSIFDTGHVCVTQERSEMLRCRSAGVLGEGLRRNLKIHETCLLGATCSKLASNSTYLISVWHDSDQEIFIRS